jgi:hypothetical protein
MYNGCDLSPEKFAEISGTVVEYLRVNGIAIPELTTGKCFNADDIAKLMINDDSFIEVKVESTKKVNANPVENALKYLSTRYKTFFSNRDTLALAFQLNKDLIQNSNDTVLINALKIVCEDETVYEPQLKKYGISRDALNTIQKWYCMSVHGN